MKTLTVIAMLLLTSTVAQQAVAKQSVIIIPDCVKSSAAVEPGCPGGPPFPW